MTHASGGMKQGRMGSRAALVGVALGMGVLAGGCANFTGQIPGGRAASFDQFTYVSTPYMPITVTLRDVRDGSELWSVDVPVHQKLVVRFYENKTRDNAQLPALMRWQLMDENDVRSLSNQMPVPGSPVRRLEMVLRDGPEYPSESAYVPATSGAGMSGGSGAGGASGAGNEPVMSTPVAPRQPEDDWGDEEAAPEVNDSFESPAMEPKMMIIEPASGGGSAGNSGGNSGGGEPPMVRNAFEPTPYGEPAVRPTVMPTDPNEPETGNADLPEADTPEPAGSEPMISEPDA